jgi:hypothetical protein
VTKPRGRVGDHDGVTAHASDDARAAGDDAADVDVKDVADVADVADAAQ